MAPICGATRSRKSDEYDDMWCRCFRRGLSHPAIQVTKTVVIGNYLFVIGYSSYKMNVTVGSTYNIGILVYGGSTYITSGIYEGNWTGPIP